MKICFFLECGYVAKNIVLGNVFANGNRLSHTNSAYNREDESIGV